jgi:hypothetical protein
LQLPGAIYACSDANVTPASVEIVGSFAVVLFPTPSCETGHSAGTPQGVPFSKLMKYLSPPCYSTVRVTEVERDSVPAVAVMVTV